MHTTFYLKQTVTRWRHKYLPFSHLSLSLCSSSLSLSVPLLSLSLFLFSLSLSLFLFSLSLSLFLFSLSLSLFLFSLLSISPYLVIFSVSSRGFEPRPFGLAGQHSNH